MSAPEVGHYDWKCGTCGMGCSSSENLTIVGPLKCWRDDCPGKLPEPPKLTPVK